MMSDDNGSKFTGFYAFKPGNIVSVTGDVRVFTNIGNPPIEHAPEKCDGRLMRITGEADGGFTFEWIDEVPDVDPVVTVKRINQPDGEP
jgi:hypothetical protein